jgi:H+-transporting ATPase
MSAGATAGAAPGEPAPSLEARLRRLDSSPQGLSAAEARARLEREGPNELAETRVHPLLRFLAYFWGPIPWMIEAAAGLSAALGRWPDFGIILALLLMNAGVGFWEEFQAGNAVEALRSKLAATARALRDGAWVELPARELVPGDVVRVRIGDVVPADLYLFDGDPIEVDQSALTGESLPASRGRGEQIFSGSVVKRGEIQAVVAATGARTFFGRTAKLVAETRVVSHFQRAVLEIGNYLMIFALGLVGLLLLVALHRGDSVVQTIQFALVLAVSGVPVAMPAVLSVTLAVGARLLARRNAVVSRLAAIEELAGMDVLCSDKTGTLTRNELTLRDVHPLGGAETAEVLRAAALASETEAPDPIDQAVHRALPDPQALRGFSRLHFRPFDPVSKRAEAEVRPPDGAPFRIAKGAPQVILELAADRDAVRAEVERAVEENAARGFRSLGVARAGADGAWHYIGVLSLFDPPREDSRETIERVESMGVDVKMVTGDQVAIARETCRQLGLGAEIFDASTFEDVKYSERAHVDDRIEGADGFAQVFPEHKYHVVDVLQRKGHIVGMTGDGVNDAPALKKADAGIAVSGATDAARAAADIVLLTPGLSVIAEAIFESRRIFERMTNYAIYRITETIRLLFFMTAAILVLNVYPVTAIMIVLLAILNDGAILTIAYDRVPAAPRPQRWDMRLVLGVATVLGTLGVIETFVLFFLAERVLELPVTGPAEKAAFIRTLIYLKLSVSGHFTVMVARTRGPFWSSRPAWILLLAVIGTQLVATGISVYGLADIAPIGWRFAGLVWAYCTAVFLVEDAAKLLAVRIFSRRHPGILLQRNLVPAS